jgi:hypothetical protein
MNTCRDCDGDQPGKSPFCRSSCYLLDAELRLSAAEAESAFYDEAAIAYFELVMERAACEGISADELERILIKLKLRDPVPHEAAAGGC